MDIHPLGTPIGCTTRIFWDFLKQSDLQNIRSAYQMTKTKIGQTEVARNSIDQSPINKSIEDHGRVSSSRASIGLDSVSQVLVSKSSS
jgi:hypothetical protein